MKKVILITILVLSCTIVFSQSDYCEKTIVEGVFISTDINNKGYRIERKKNSQIEYYNNDTLKIFSSIEWISESEYKVVVTERVNNPKEWENFPKEYLFKIIECNGNIHKVEVSFLGQTFIFELEKVNKNA